MLSKITIIPTFFLAAVLTCSVLTTVVQSSASTTSAATDCTLYASPSGSSSNSGTSPSSPLTLQGAAGRTQPGSVVCLLPGTYYVDTPFQIPRSGSSSSWIVYKSYNGGAVLAPRSGSYDLIQVTAAVGYIEINGLQFDGHNIASGGISCKGCDHLRIIGNRISYTGAAGIVTYADHGTGKHPDYVIADHNQIYHSGYNQGWSSGISYNGHAWYDQYQGFHSFVTNNIISGVYDNSSYHSDGNGIIMDNQSGANTPPVLIANNVVYENCARCIHSRYATHNWIVNNTCYKNGLRPANVAEYALYGASGDYVINNIVYGWANRYLYWDVAGTMAKYYRNIWYSSGTGTNDVPSSVSSDPNQLKHADPHFANPPYVDPSAQGQYNNALPPDKVTNQFYLQPGSPAIGAGIDPTTIPGISSDIINGLHAYVFTDINGNPRPHSSAFDLGAYESSGGTQSTQSTQSMTLTPVADSYVDSANLNANYGSANPLKVAGSPQIDITYFKFDLLSLAGKTVSSATLRLYVYDGSVGTHNVKSVSDTSWTEAGITYINRPSLGSIIASVTNPTTGTWMEVDVTSQVKARLGQLISFGVDTVSADVLRFSSTEVTQKPQLVIRY